MIIYITIEINKMSLSCCNNAVKLISRTQEGNNSRIKKESQKTQTWLGNYLS